MALPVLHRDEATSVKAPHAPPLTAPQLPPCATVVTSNAWQMRANSFERDMVSLLDDDRYITGVHLDN